MIETVGETYRRELAEADAVKDWKERQKLRESADNANTKRLSRIEELAKSFAENEGRGKATSIFQEMKRIITEQGVDEAIAYIATQRSSILKAVKDHTAAARERNRADLEPLLHTAGLHNAKGQADEARSLYKDVFAVEPGWPKAQHAYVWFLFDQGDIARVRTTLADAGRDYEEALRMAKQLAVGDHTNTEWHRDLSVSYYRLGVLAVSRGKLDQAADYYAKGLEIAKQLAEDDPANTRWQRDLWVCYWRLATLCERQKKDKQAKIQWEKSLEVFISIEKRGLHISTHDKKYLEILRRKVGESFSDDSLSHSRSSN